MIPKQKYLMYLINIFNKLLLTPDPLARSYYTTSPKILSRSTSTYSKYNLNLYLWSYCLWSVSATRP